MQAQKNIDLLTLLIEDSKIKSSGANSFFSNNKFVQKINTTTNAIIIHPTKQQFIKFILTNYAKSYENSTEF
jgi:hypothetical protein